jgi:hypothetical protein
LYEFILFWHFRSRAESIIILFNLFLRNRYRERAALSLPIKCSLGLKEVDVEVDFLDLSPAEAQYMVTHKTLELPGNFFRYKVRKSRAFATLKYVAFQVRDKFPNNIVRLKTGEIMYVTKIKSDFMPDEASKGGTVKEVHSVHGKLFDQVLY